MAPERIENLKQQRDALVAQVQLFQSVPESERPAKPSALKSWLAQLHQMESLGAQIDTLLAKTAPRTVRRKPVDALAQADESEAVVLARIPKGKRAEMRVSVKPWQNRRVVDIRIWALPKDGDGEMKPSRKRLPTGRGSWGRHAT